jgi:hypothetical protein
MNHRHLLPDEIDRFLDDAHLGDQSLTVDVWDCDECRAMIEQAQFVVDTLEDVPHFAPSHTFADRVMSQVPVFVPWHVSARDTVQRWLPQSRTARIAVAVVAIFTTSLATIAIIWLGSQADLVTLASGAMESRIQGAVLDVARTILAGLFGDQTFTIIQRGGTTGLAAALLGLGTAAVGSVIGLRALATAASRRRI